MGHFGKESLRNRFLEWPILWNKRFWNTPFSKLLISKWPIFDVNRKTWAIFEVCDLKVTDFSKWSISKCHIFEVTVNNLRDLTINELIDFISTGWNRYFVLSRILYLKIGNPFPFRWFIFELKSWPIQKPLGKNLFHSLFQKKSSDPSNLP